MINHARTLLLNEANKKSEPGEELIPSDFTPLVLNNPIQEVRRRLFGGKPDRAMLNYRLRQIMTLLHGLDTEEFLLDLDPRITYAVGEDDELLSGDVYGVQTSQYLFSPDLAVFIQGTPASPDASGASKLSYTFRQTSTETTLQTFVPTAMETDLTGTITEETPALSGPILLPGSGYSFKLELPSGFEVTTPPLTPVGIDFTVYLRPTRTLSDLETLFLGIGEPTLLKLFSVGTAEGQAEPFKTFRNLWFNHPEQPYRLAGILLATIYQAEKIRNAGQ